MQDYQAAPTADETGAVQDAERFHEHAAATALSLLLNSERESVQSMYSYAWLQN